MVEDSLLEDAVSRDRPAGEGRDANPAKAGAEASAAQGSVLDDVLSGLLHRLAGFGALALLVALGLLFTVSWRGLQRLEPFYAHLEQQEQLQQIERRIGTLLVADAGQAPSPDELGPLKDQLQRMIDVHAFSDQASAARLGDALKALDATPRSEKGIEVARSYVGEVLDRERQARRSELRRIRRNARTEMVLAAVALLVLPGTALLVLRILRNQITRPLRDLSGLLRLIGEERHRPVPTDNVATSIRPIMESYNRLVERLTAALQTNKRYQEQLQSQVEAAAQTLVRQRAELAEADRLSALGEMSARVAHELRNPLAGIKLGISNLAHDSVDADQKERLALIGAEVDRMARLLDQLLLKPRKHEEPLVEIDLRVLLAELLALVRYQIPERIALINAAPDGMIVKLQRDSIRQMLLNLVLNACQAIGNAPGHVTVSLTHENNMLGISVSDDGPGFPVEFLERGIRPFFTRRHGGSGLGLSTVQRMAQAMGGRIALANCEPHGARVTIIIGNGGAS
ncbi:MAG TPA: HAMP domain-containing sensor histidine kinase [Hyphomicrobiaceae bacterium]|nr:HAMP domain-containing sensor histidine kinase [Hyphomicrobiaceae bacterium]